MDFNKLFRLLLIILTCGVILHWWKKEGKRDFLKHKTLHNPLNPRPAGINDRREHKPFFQSFPIHMAGLWLLPVIGLSLFFGDTLKEYSYFFRASLLQMVPTEFTGTVPPIEKVPNWTELSDSERQMSYLQLPKSKLIDIPNYLMADIQAGKNYGSSSDYQRNAYITYPVPHLGNYMLDGTENSGSHTGIDIKAPIGTPVRSIAAGTVFRTDNQKTGFGKYVTIAHVQIPDPANPNQKTTLFSNYAHLSQVSVQEGETVTKGQVIGKVGDTGFATTPHLHFQIDRDTAPFHPYWPFQWKDVQAAGLNSYFEGVKHGVGKGNAIKYTTHPVNFIAKFDNYIAENLVASTTIPVVTSDNEQITSLRQGFGGQAENKEQTTNNETEPKVESQKEKENSEIRIPNSEIENPEDLEITFETDRSYIPGEEKVVKIRVNEANLVASSGILIDSTLKGLAQVSPTSLSTTDFTDNVAEIKVSTDSGRTFKLIASGEFGEVKSSSLRPQVFADVESGHTYADAISYLKENEIVKGYPDGTFKPEGTLNRAEAVKILLAGNDIEAALGNSTFPDVAADAWFANYVTTAADRKIVKGYGDGSFKPGNTISRAEFLKVAILTAGFEPTEVTNQPYDDVSLDAWYAKFFSFAKEHSLLRLKRGGFIVPNDPITRAEAADVMYRLAKIGKR